MFCVSLFCVLFYTFQFAFRYIESWTIECSAENMRCQLLTPFDFNRTVNNCSFNYSSYWWIESKLEPIKSVCCVSKNEMKTIFSRKNEIEFLFFAHRFLCEYFSVSISHNLIVCKILFLSSLTTFPSLLFPLPKMM